jgi:hypothetical protein
MASTARNPLDIRGHLENYLVRREAARRDRQRGSGGGRRELTGILRLLLLTGVLLFGAAFCTADLFSVLDLRAGGVTTTGEVLSTGTEHGCHRHCSHHSEVRFTDQSGATRTAEIGGTHKVGKPISLVYRSGHPDKVRARGALSLGDMARDIILIGICLLLALLTGLLARDAIRRRRARAAGG